MASRPVPPAEAPISPTTAPPGGSGRPAMPGLEIPGAGGARLARAPRCPMGRLDGESMPGPGPALAAPLWAAASSGSPSPERTFCRCSAGSPPGR